MIVTGSLEQRSWETQEGEKRSVVEVRIDEIGPSLRWATATGHQDGTERRRLSGRRGRVGAARARDIPPGPVGREDYGPDEAPF